MDRHLFTLVGTREGAALTASLLVAFEYSQVSGAT